MLFIIQAYVIIAQSRDIFGSGMVHHSVFRKLIYTPEWFLSIILQKKFVPYRGGPAGKTLMTANYPWIFGCCRNPVLTKTSVRSIKKLKFIQEG